MIKQAISCDICGDFCGTERKQTHHWFVAYEQGGELRVSGWNSRNKLRPGSKHLCGQTCLHKLVDEFMAKVLALRVQPAAQIDTEVNREYQLAANDTSLAPGAANVEAESSARLITPPMPAPPMRLPLRSDASPVGLPGRLQTAEPAAPSDEPARNGSRNWRAEAWERERERELRANGRRPEIAARRHFNA